MRRTQLQLGGRERAHRALFLGHQEGATDALDRNLAAALRFGIDFCHDTPCQAIDQNGPAGQLVEQPAGRRARRQRGRANAVAVDDGDYRGGGHDGAERGVTNRSPAHLL